MNNCIGCCVALLITCNSFAQTASSSLPPGLIKVTRENNPKCVTFVLYQGEMYCSVVALDKTPADPKALSYEKQTIQFDTRPWIVGWAQKTDKVSTIEYTPVGSDIDNWNELITSQFFPDLNVTPAEFGNQFIDNLDKSGITYTVNPLIQEPDLLVFEFKVTKPDNLQQDEIQKVVKGKDGLYVLHYAVKKSDMSEADRAQWIENIKKSTLKD